MRALRVVLDVLVDDAPHDARHDARRAAAATTVEALATLVARQRWLLDAALRSAERAGFLAERVPMDEELAPSRGRHAMRAQTDEPWSAS